MSELKSGTLRRSGLLREMEARRALELASGLWKVKQLSESWMEWSHYLLLRSRGFAVRSAGNLLIECLETAGIAAVASSVTTHLSALTVAGGFFLSAGIEASFHAYRCSAISGRIWAPRRFAAALSSVVGSVYALIALYLAYRGMPGTAIAVLCLRGLGMTVDTALAGLVSDINLQYRVYQPPIYNGIAIVVSLATIHYLPITLSAPHAFFGILGVHQLMKVVLQANFYLRCRVIRQTAKVLERRSPEHAAWTDSTRTARNEELAAKTQRRRFLLITSFYWQSTLLSAVAVSNGLSTTLFWLWIAKTIAFKCIDRPFRAISVDLFRAMARKQWPLVLNQIGRCTGVGYVVAGLSLTGAVLVAVFTRSSFAAIAGLWLGACLLNRALFFRRAVVGQELDTFTATWCARLAGVTLIAIAWAAGATLMEAVTLAALAELGLAACLIYRSSTAGLRADLERTAAARLRSDRQLEYPASFASVFLSVAPTLEKLRIPNDVYLIHLVSAVRRNTKMMQLMSELALSFRRNDRVVALNSKLLLAWLPGSRSVLPVRTRLFLRFPLDVERVDPLSPRHLALFLRHATGQAEPLELGEKFRGEALLGYLEVRSREIAGPAFQGSWWTLDQDRPGSWVGLGSPPSPALNRALHRLSAKSTEELQLFSHRAHRDPEIPDAFLLLRPLGGLLAILQTPMDPGLATRLIETLNLRWLGAELRTAFSARPNRALPSLSALGYFECRRTLESLSDYLGVQLSADLEPRAGFTPIGRCAEMAPSESVLNLRRTSALAAPIGRAPLTPSSPPQIQPASGKKVA